MALANEFDRLFTKCVPHLFEMIFLSVDYESFTMCLEVSRSWRDLLTSESFVRKVKSVFREDIQTDLLLHAWVGNADLIQRVLSAFKVDINYTIEPYGSPLLQAARNGHKHVVQLLLERGADPNMADHVGVTPLHYANKKEVAQLLLGRGAEMNMADRYGNTPLSQAALNGHIDAALILLDRGARPNIGNIVGDTPLHFAAYEGHKDVVRLLLNRGAEPNMAGQVGRTPLHFAAERGHKDVLHVLIDGGAEPNRQDQEGINTLDYAIINGQMDSAYMLAKNLGIKLHNM